MSYLFLGLFQKTSSEQDQDNQSALRLPRLSTVVLFNQPVFKKVDYLLKSEASSLGLKHYLQVSLLMASASICTILYRISSRLIS